MAGYLSYFSRDASASFPYEIGEKISGLDSSQSIWSIHEGKMKKAPHTKATVFVYDVKAGSDVTTEVAKNCLKRIRTLRHPNIVTYVEGMRFIHIRVCAVKNSKLQKITDSDTNSESAR